MNQNSSSSIDSETNQQLFDEDKYLTTIFETLDSFLRGCNLMLVNLHQSKTLLNIFLFNQLIQLGMEVILLIQSLNLILKNVHFLIKVKVIFIEIFVN